MHSSIYMLKCIEYLFNKYRILPDKVITTQIHGTSTKSTLSETDLGSMFVNN